jgi:two-component system cell cycle sensor histidine kinase/response regulator CckA
MNPTENTAGKGTVLVVDDDPAVLIVIKTILTSSDYRVLLAATAEDAVRLGRQKHIHIDLALLDVRMPGMQGTDIAQELQSTRPKIRVLYMSGFLDDEIIRIKLLDEHSGFLPKPFHSASLLEAVRQAMEPHPRAGYPEIHRATHAVVSCAADAR